MLIVLLLIGLSLLALTTQTAAQTEAEIITYLTDLLNSEGVPIISIEVQRNSLLDNLTGLPFRVEIIIKSASSGQKYTPDDPLYIQTVSRAVLLARGKGFPINTLTTIVQNAQGQTIAWMEEPIESEIIIPEIQTSPQNDSVIREIVKEELNLYGLTLEDLTLATRPSGDQILAIKLSTSDLLAANQALPSFMPSFYFMFYMSEENFNVRHGTQIGTVTLEINNLQTGETLLKYSLDVSTGRESWWMDEDLTKDWFPHPPE